MQVWRERLLPLLEQHLADKVDSVAAYQLLYHEAALANLLEVPGCCLPACNSWPVALCPSTDRLANRLPGSPLAARAPSANLSLRVTTLEHVVHPACRCCCSIRTPVRAWERRRL